MGAVTVVLDLLGVFVFALSGALLGVRIQFDLVGVLVLGVVTGLGGGIMRDVLIGSIPPASFTDWRYVVVPLVAGLMAFRFHPDLGRIERTITWFDALGLGLFCVLGTQKALFFGVLLLIAVLTNNTFRRLALSGGKPKPKVPQKEPDKGPDTEPAAATTTASAPTKEGTSV